MTQVAGRVRDLVKEVVGPSHLEVGRDEGGHGWPNGALDLPAALGVAFDREIARVSGLDDDSNAVCRHFHGEVMRRLEGHLDAASREVLDQAFDEEIARVSHVRFAADDICRAFYGHVRANVDARLLADEPEETQPTP